MDHFRKILFFADGARGERAALAHAIDVAAHHGASLDLVAVVPELGTTDERLGASIRQLQRTLIAERRSHVDKLLDDARPADSTVTITTRVVAGEKDFIPIINLVTDENFDLVIKSVDRAGAVRAALFGNRDLRLMRECPCPVWIIKPGRRKKISVVLAALDVTSGSKESLALAASIVDIAAAIATREGATLHLLSAWKEPIDPALGKRLTVTAYGELKEKYKESVKERFETLRDQAPQEVVSHLVRRQPDTAICGFVSDYDVDLLVMGTVSRSGIPGILIGNTAERVLSQVDCSVLTLKPSGFQTRK